MPPNICTWSGPKCVKKVLYVTRKIVSSRVDVTPKKILLKLTDQRRPKFLWWSWASIEFSNFQNTVTFFCKIVVGVLYGFVESVRFGWVGLLGGPFMCLLKSFGGQIFTHNISACLDLLYTAKRIFYININCISCNRSRNFFHNPVNRNPYTSKLAATSR